MGTRINVLLDHTLSDSFDRDLVLKSLEPSTAAALAVREYWKAANPESHSPMELTAWRADSFAPGKNLLHNYSGPGSLFLTVTAKAAKIRTGGRWRGFLSIEPMRQIHLEAFRHIAKCLGARRLALYPDDCAVDDLFWNGRTQQEGIALMERMWGPPQSSVEWIEPSIVASAKDGVPFVWFLESTHVSAEPATLRGV